MFTGILGLCSPGQFILGALGDLPAILPPSPAPADRTFIVPRGANPWRHFKTPEEVLNFSFNWAKEIGSDTIVTSEWVLSSPNIVNDASAVDVSNTIVTILLSGGIAPNGYNVTNIITTESGLTLDATFTLYVQQYNQ